MANTHKTKAELLQELESIKGLLREEDDIPILQEELAPRTSSTLDMSLNSSSPSVLPGQGSLFDEPVFDETVADERATHPNEPAAAAPTTSNTPAYPKSGFGTFGSSGTALSNNLGAHRPLAKATGENPFLPQHIRERLHGNNPPPLFEYETARKIVNSTKDIQHKINQPRQHLVNQVITQLMPLIEKELRQRLYAMSVDELEKLLNEDED
ncbi:hypothetical protein [Cellvibrio japonicus]|nr:hypothetical protein [Cellvibrio japonicus]QEI12006.1 hypothetical protein FY117_07045 [Cellvibrio japonicus]QEI15581.1 hypothetical protein FY116_07050 [Cellvibrio japonicus]QEI19159.1 hypothetical protein FY115_07045 [Cellvibrio japonicus]